MPHAPARMLPYSPPSRLFGRERPSKIATKETISHATIGAPHVASKIIRYQLSETQTELTVTLTGVYQMESAFPRDRWTPDHSLRRLITRCLKTGSWSLSVENLNRSQETKRKSSKEADPSYIIAFNPCRSTESDQDPQNLTTLRLIYQIPPSIVRRAARMVMRIVTERRGDV